jgi:hypothetical protein
MVSVSGDMTIDAPVALFTSIVVLKNTARSMSIIPNTVPFKFLPSPLKVQ